MKVAIDFDNTFYTPNRDVDDGLALMYLLGSSQVELVGITSCFGNAPIEEVDQSSQRLIEELDLESIPYAKGAAEVGDYLTPASQLLVDLADRYAGDLCLLATGSLANLQGAYLRDPLFFDKVKQIVLMGGTVAPLIFAKSEMLELNFSCDPQATLTVLSKGKNVSVLTGNACLDVLFTREDYDQAFAGQEGCVTRLIETYSDPWFVDNDLEYGIKGFYNWDSLAAAYLVDPQLFQDNLASYRVSIQSLSKGSLLADQEDSTSYAVTKPIRQVSLNLPRVKSAQAVKQALFDRWLAVDYQLERRRIDGKC